MKLLHRDREVKKNYSRGKITFPQNGAHKMQKLIDVRGILVVGFLNPTAPLDGKSIYNTHRNAMDRLVSGKHVFFVVTLDRFCKNHDTDTFLLLLKRVL